MRFRLLESNSIKKLNILIPVLVETIPEDKDEYIKSDIIGEDFYNALVDLNEAILSDLNQNISYIKDMCGIQNLSFELNKISEPYLVITAEVNNPCDQQKLLSTINRYLKKSATIDNKEQDVQLKVSVVNNEVKFSTRIY